MPRPKRINHPDSWYFILNKTTKKNDIFGDDELKNQFLFLLKKVTLQYNLDIHSYCILNSGYLLLVHTKNANLSLAMSVLNAQYSKFFNKKKQKEGPVFKERFKSILIEDESYLISLTRYIHLYPSQEKLIKKPEDYPWSSCKAFLSDVRQTSWQKTDLISTLVSGNYAQFLKKGNAQQIIALLSSKRLPRKI